MAHSAVLSVKAGDCDLANTTSPDFIIHDQNETQYLGWFLRTSHLTFAGATGSAAWPSPGERDKTLDLNGFITGKQSVDPGNAALVALPSGTLTAGPTSQKFDIRLKQTGKVLAHNKPLSSTIVWNGTATALKWAGNSITLNQNAEVCVTNEAADLGNGNDHLVCYFTLLTPTPTPGQEIELVSPTLTVMNLPFFDCVPPAAMP